jgi:peptidyl-prolyl cis-trans isomerase D
MARVSFEFPDSLEDTASEVNIPVSTSAWLSNSASNTAPFNDPKVLEVAFSDLVLEESLNSDVIELSDRAAIVLRLNTYKEADVKPLTEVEDNIKAILVSQKATEKAQNTIEALLVQFKAGNDITTQLTKNYMSFTTKENIGRYSADLDQSITREAFVLPHPTEDTISASIVPLSNGDLALVEVQSVKENVARYSTDLDQSITREAFVLPHPAEGTISASTVALSNGDLALVEVQAVNVIDSIANPQLAQQQTSQLAQSAYKSYVDSLKVGAKITHGKVAEPANY